MDGRGVFTHADGLKYEVKSVIMFIFKCSYCFCVYFVKVQIQHCASDPTGRFCVQRAHGPGRLHLAGWQHLRGPGV